MMDFILLVLPAVASELESSSSYCSTSMNIDNRRAAKKTVKIWSLVIYHPEYIDCSWSQTFDKGA